MTWLVFGQTLGYEFVDYDDEVYIADNPVILGGLSLKGIVWAFTHNVNFNWTPLTVISHMLDCQLYGTNAGWHHLTSVLLHLASVIVLFLVLNRMTAALWRSAFVAAVFAIHPLHVESVAWIAERKDVLSGLFFMLTLWAYVRYAQGRSRVEGRGSRAGSSSLALDPRPSTLDYWLVLLFFALGLMSKPMAVTLPFVLLLLDYWPLKRFTQPGGRLIPWRLIVEKVPLLALSGAVCVATFFAQQEAIAPLPLSMRIGNAAVSYVVYLRQMVCPAELAVLYPYPQNGFRGWEITLAVGLLAAISSGVFLRRQRQPYLWFGWLWYLGMLVPVIGIVQVGSQARADRYTYLPQIGLYVLLAWAAADLCAGWRHRRLALGSGSAIILLALMFCARAQAAWWRNSELLWTHTLACTSDNFTAHNNLGNELLQQGRMNEAITQFQTALQIKPDCANAHFSFGNALLQQGKVDEAIAQFQTALQIQPDNAEACNNLGNVLLKTGRVDEAITQFQKALQIKPDYVEVHNNLGNVLLQKGRVDEAMAHYQQALQLKPDSEEALANLGNALLQKGRAPEAIAQFQKALQIQPDHIEVLNNLAWVLATSSQASLRNGSQAVELAQRANQLAGGGNPIVLHTLAAAYAEAGRFGEAQRSAQEAMVLARAAGQSYLVEQLDSESKLYAAGLPLHQESK
jgi:tetratricopeptide (TPR) repeat protein